MVMVIMMMLYDVEEFHIRLGTVITEKAVCLIKKAKVALKQTKTFFSNNCNLKLQMKPSSTNNQIPRPEINALTSLRRILSPGHQG